jgi:hypothetical protein
MYLPRVIDISDHPDGLSGASTTRTEQCEQRERCRPRSVLMARQRPLHARNRCLETDAPLTIVPETAALSQLQLEPPLRSAVARLLTRRLALLFCASTVAMITAIAHVTVVLHALGMGGGYALLAALFPTDAGLRSRSARLVLVPIGGARWLGTSWALLAELRTMPAYGHAACNAAHGLSSLLLGAAVALNLLLHATSRHSWAAIRAMNVAVALAIVATNGAVAALEAGAGERRYVPVGQGGITLAVALARGGVTLLVMGLVTASNRRALAALGLRAGVAHVSVSLEYLSSLRSGGARKASEPGLDSYCRLGENEASSLLLPDGSVRADSAWHGSHHTAKLSANAAFEEVP